MSNGYTIFAGLALFPADLFTAAIQNGTDLLLDVLEHCDPNYSVGNAEVMVPLIVSAPSQEVGVKIAVKYSQTHYPRASPA